MKRQYRHWRLRSGDVNRGADGNLVVDLDDVRHGHADAAVGGRRAQGPDLRGAVDARAVEDAEPARLQRVVGGTAGDDLPGQAAGPRRVRHAPGRVHGLVLHVVEPGGRLEPDLPDRDRVGLDQLQLLVDAQLEVAPVDGDDRRVLAGQVVDPDLRLGLLHPGLDDAFGRRVGQLVADGVLQRRLVERHAGLAAHLVEPAAREVDLGAGGGALDLALHAL